MDNPVALVSRQSPLAVAQAIAIRAMLGKASDLPEDEWERAFPLETHVTEGDKNLASSLSEVGGKGLFVKEIEGALLNGSARIAIHSMKDMPAVMPDGLVLAAVPPREDPRDAFVTLDGGPLTDLPQGAVVGTSSVRRAAQLQRLRPDVEIIPFRGNVGTRLGKLRSGEAKGTFLAQAGLNRLGHDEVKRTPVDLDQMLPAISQGVLCIQARADDEEALELCAKISCPSTERISAAERAFLQALDGSCRTPMAGIAEETHGGLRFRAEILSPDGREAEADEVTIALEGSHADQIMEASARGRDLALSLLDRSSANLREALGHA
ncbi:MAG: hydroxymethylbilane synthase [Parvularculaceae bacterium]|nr:hydroxymethylbilane synthase [Parvularculaceae bacterium]